MASAGSIYVDLLLRDASYVSGWNKARRTTNQASNQIQGDVNKIGQSFKGVLNPVDNLSSSIRNLSGVIAGAFSVQKIVAYSDQWRQLEGRLNIVAGEFGNVAKTQQDLFEIAQRTRQPLDGILSFYSRLAQFIPEAERAQYDLLGVTESVSTALAITGETSASATGAMIQFTQAIGTNFEAAGQELRSLQEQAPRLTQALMKALGDGTKSLQQLKEEGVLTRQSVLNALSGMGEEGRRLQEELAKVPLTVGQAFTRLDNAFLKFIGQSREVNNVTGGLALVISSLAENLNIISNAIISVSALFVGRLVASLVSSAIAWVKNTQEIIRYNQVLRVQAILNGQAAASVGTLSIATSRFVALLGGPVLASLTLAASALFAYKTGMDSIREVSVEFLGIGERIKSINIELVNASKQRTIELKKERDALIAKAQAEIADTQALINKFKVLQQIGGSGLGIGIGILARRGESAARDRLDQQFKELDNLNTSLIDYIQNGVQSDGSDTISNATEKATKSIEKWLVKQREALETLRQEADYIGKTSIEISKLKDAREFEAQIAERSYGLKGRELERFREQAEAIKILRQEVIQYNYEASRSAQAGFEEFSAKYQEDATNMAKNIQGVLENAFKGAEDAFVEFTKTGKLNFKDLANSIIEDLIRIQFKNAVSGLLGGLGGGGGGLFGSLLSGIGGLFGGGGGVPASQVGIARPAAIGPSSAGFGTGIKFFADGGYLGPGQWGIAGEAGAELLYGGKTGVSVFNQDQIGGKGNVYQIDARGADQGAVVRLEQALLALAGPGVIEQRVNMAQARGSL